MGFIAGLVIGAAVGYVAATHPEWFRLGGE
jgi:hypothetical protein